MDRSTILQAVFSETFRKFSKDLVRALKNYAREGIIAEGVETQKELKVVKEMGMHIVQGFLFGKPKEIKTSRRD
jgi:EAL domain-containing protein (putative c-di-GMP-specific phosphodiesterase class I)